MFYLGGTWHQTLYPARIGKTFYLQRMFKIFWREFSRNDDKV